MNHEASASVDSLDVARDSNERDHVLLPKHKIFLSHSGAQKSFVADLDDALKRRDRYPFFDRSRSSLPVGDTFPNHIFDAIKQCEVGVVVLSEEFFTRSKWPMLELATMVEESRKRKIKIILVFYSISRKDCRDPSVQDKWMNDCWNEWKRQDMKRIEFGKWKSALQIFGSRTGLEMKVGMLDRDLRAEIVDAICKDVRPEMRWDDSKVEGKTRLCQEICRKVYKGLQPKDLKDGVQMVGLYGMGGIGKTTACKILCNELSKDYRDRVCHVEFGSHSELELQQMALKVFSDLDAELLDKISDIEVGYQYLQTCIVKERVFLALDNVSDDSKEQAKSFLKVKFGDGSMVLMTARSMNQLLRLGVKKGDCFSMPELELEEAKSLFVSHAGLEKNEVDKVLLKKCVKRCYFGKGQLSSSSGDGKHYHPLALKVLGSEVGDFIRQHDVARQAELLNEINTFNLSRQKEDPMFCILRSSFDSLLEEDQLLFLHAALFLPKVLYETEFFRKWLGMVHEEEDNIIAQRLEGLKRRSLLESFGKYDDDFTMHDLWREFAAAEIEGGKWKYQLFLSKSVKRHGPKVDLTGVPKMRVVKLMEVWEDVALDVRGLKQLRSLEFLRYWSPSVLKVNGLGTLESLTFLRWQGVASSACIRELGWLTNLQVLDLTNFHGVKLPDMSKLTNLRILNIGFSRFLQRIELRNLPNLARLNIHGCGSLQRVDISGCRSIRHELELWSGSTLEELNVSSCPLLPSVYGLCGFTELRKLDITGCCAINELDGLRGLVALEKLRARQCDSLNRLPRCRLLKLRVLDIEPWKVPAGFQSQGLRVIREVLIIINIYVVTGILVFLLFTIT